MPLRVDTHLPAHSCAQDSYPHPWTSARPRGHGQHVPGHSHLLGLLPLLLISMELPVGVNLGIFFWGTVLLHDPHKQATPALPA